MGKVLISTPIRYLVASFAHGRLLRTNLFKALLNGLLFGFVSMFGLLEVQILSINVTNIRLHKFFTYKLLNKKLKDLRINVTYFKFSFDLLFFN